MKSAALNVDITPVSPVEKGKKEPSSDLSELTVAKKDLNQSEWLQGWRDRFA